jgi:hypothetical protein
MSWFKVDGDLPGHPKVLRLAALTGMEPDLVVGKLNRLWGWAQKYAEDGDLSRFDPTEISLALGIPPGIDFLKNLIACGFVDSYPYTRIHDWWDYIGPWLNAKYKRSPAKWKRIRRLYNTPVSQHRHVTVTAPVTEQLPNSDVTGKIRGDVIRKDVELQDPLTPTSGGLASQENHQPEGDTGQPPNAETPRPAKRSLRALGLNPRAIAKAHQKALEMEAKRQAAIAKAEERQQETVSDMTDEERDEIMRQNAPHLWMMRQIRKGRIVDIKVITPDVVAA